MKEFYTYEQQLEKLRKDGLIIVDENKAIDFLKFEGYYNVINGYASTFEVDNKFCKGTTFDDIRYLYDFDKSLRSIVYKYTSSIETHIKALIAHEFSRVHGVDEKVYLQKGNFTRDGKAATAVTRLIDECNSVISEALNRNSNKYRQYIAHNHDVHGHVPMWVLIRALTFGTTSIFYKNMLDNERDRVADNYNITADQLANMLEVVVSYRNIVAHGERTFCARLPRTRLSTNLEITKKLCIAKNAKGEIKFGRNDFLSLLICCKYLLSSLDFTGFIFELESSLDNLAKHLSPSMMGKIKILMGLKSNSWKILPKLKK